MKWGYSGYTKSETRRLVSEVKAKEDMQSYIDDAENCDTSSIKLDKSGLHKLKTKEF
ncbi:MAG: hypothetical protein PHQ35_09745 [Phycisphaerae bacterium]|nr:hypothetical protein [Phycisphaerae bacterium]MDD5239988.1 hypothetical protein [Candidatus Nanoarchaeia archaeon]